MQADKNPAKFLETIPFKTYTGGVIVIEAKLDGQQRTLNFILDTGSGGISLDSTTCAELNIVLKQSDTIVMGIAGSRRVSFAFNRKLITGNLTTDKLNFYVNDYSLLGSVYGERIDGIIGYGLLSRYILDINFDSSHIKFYEPGKYKYRRLGTLLKPTLRKLIAMPLTIRDKEKAISNFYLDTGAGLCLLITDQFLKYNNILLKRRRPVVTQVQGLGGKKAMRLTVVKFLKVGPYTFRNVPANLYNDEANITSYPYTAGLLGNDIMRRFNITLNYPEKEIHITPNSFFTDRFDYAYSGLSLYQFNDKIFIDDIVEKSPAERAGLKNGDELISVNSNILGNIQQYEILLQNVNEKILMIIKRNGTPYIILLQPISIR